MDFNTIKTIVEAVAVILFALVSWGVKKYLVPFIHTKMDEIEYQLFIDFIEKAVRSAKQTLIDNEEKKQHVLEQCIKWMNNHNIEMTIDQLNELIEGIYNAIKMEDKSKE